MRNRRNPVVLITLLLFGALIGGLAGEFLSGYTYLSWMAFGGVNGYKDLFAFSLNPALDFRVVRLGFDFALRINAGSILGMLVGFLAFIKFNI